MLINNWVLIFIENKKKDEKRCEPTLTLTQSCDVRMRATILAAMWQPLTAVSAMLYLNSIALLLSRRPKY